MRWSSLVCAVLSSVASAANPLTALNALEAENDRVEAAFDALCARVKAGHRDGHPRADGLVWATGCSLRALSLGPATKGQRVAHVLWEVEGFQASGARTSLRGEAEVVLATGAAVSIVGWTDSTRETVARDRPRFVESAETAGLTLPPLEARRLKEAELLAGGLAVRDVTGDGVPEVFTVDAHQVLRFDRTAAAPLRYARSTLFRFPEGVLATSVVGGDFDGDGDVDLLVTGYPRTTPVVLRNDDGAFVPAPLPRAVRGNFVSAVPADLDGDGDLDLALLPYDLGAGFPWDLLEARDGERPVLVRGGPGVTFLPWAQPARSVTPRWTLAGVAADLLREGRPQLYLANDFGSNDLYRVLPDGGLRDEATAVGLDDPGNGMSADVGDFDGDGALDLAVANMFSKAGTRVVGAAKVPPRLKARLEKFSRGNTLYLARDGGFVEVARAQGVNRGLWAFATLLADVDDDGRLDVAVANGYLSRPNRRDL